MTSNAPLFSTKNQLFPKAILCFLFLICSTSFVFSGNLTFQKAKKEILKNIEGKDDFSEYLLNYIIEHKVEAFASKEDWYRTCKFSVVQAEREQGEYFAHLCSVVGKRMHYHGYYEDSFYYLYKANKSIKEQPPTNKEFYPFFHESYGLSLFYYRRYSDAKREFKLALEGKDWLQIDQVGILNSLGLVYRDLGNIDSARYYFNQALSKAKEHKIKGWYGVLSGNLGHLYYLQGDYQQAEKLVMYDYLESQKNAQEGSSINAGLLLIQICIDEGRIAEAAKFLKEIEVMVLKHGYNIHEYRVLYQARNLVYQAQGNYHEALESYKMASLYEDTILSLKTEENLKKTEFQIHFEQQQSELSLVREKEHFNEWMITILSLLIGSIIVCSFLIIRGIIRRRKRENQLLELKNEKAERELAHTEKEMRSILSNLIEKNALVEQLTSEIEGFQNHVDSKFNEERSKMLGRLQSITLLTDDDWLEFKKLFERLNPNFFSRLLQAAPDLTNAEIRLVTLIKLNLSNLEMARVLGISPDSVRKTGLRLRKKWNIEQQEDLVKFVLNL